MLVPNFFYLGRNFENLGLDNILGLCHGFRPRLIEDSDWSNVAEESSQHKFQIAIWKSFPFSSISTKQLFGIWGGYGYSQSNKKEQNRSAKKKEIYSTKNMKNFYKK